MIQSSPFSLYRSLRRISNLETVKKNTRIIITITLFLVKSKKISLRIFDRNCWVVKFAKKYLELNKKAVFNVGPRAEIFSCVYVFSLDVQFNVVWYPCKRTLKIEWPAYQYSLFIWEFKEINESESNQNDTSHCFI